MSGNIWKALWCAGLLVFASQQVWATGDMKAANRMDIVTRNEVIINATPDAIWPYILQMNKWKKGARLIPISGSPDTVGEKFKAVFGGDAALFYVENVELVPEQFRTIRMNELDGTLIGYASLRLTPSGQATLVQYDVYAYVQSPYVDLASSLETRQAKDAEFIENSRKRFDEELSILKGMVGSGPR